MRTLTTLLLLTLCYLLYTQSREAEAYMRSHGASESHINRALRD